MYGLNTRTTGAVEAVNSSIQQLFAKRPNILQFTDYLRLYDSIKTTDLYQLLQKEILNEKYARKRTEDRKRDQKIKHFTDLLKAKEISISEFLQAMSSSEVY